MKKRNFIFIIACITVAIILAVTLIENADKNPFIGFWQEVNEVNNTIRIFEFSENGYLTVITLNEQGHINTNSYTYSFSERSETVLITWDNWDEDTYRYSINNNDLILYDGDYIDSTWERINNIDFLEKEQVKRKEEEQKRQEDEQRRKEEQKRQEEEYERKLQELRYEFYEFATMRYQEAESKLLGKWVKDNDMFRDTYEFFEDGTVIHYADDIVKAGTTYTGTYEVYPGDTNLSEQELLQFENGDFVPSEYDIFFKYDNGYENMYTLVFIDDYFRLKDSSWGNGWRFDRIN